MFSGARATADLWPVLIANRGRPGLSTASEVLRGPASRFAPRRQDAKKQAGRVGIRSAPLSVRFAS